MEKKYIYIGLGALVVIGLGIYLYKNRLPDTKEIKISADGTTEDEGCKEVVGEETSDLSMKNGIQRGLPYHSFLPPSFNVPNVYARDANGTMAITPFGSGELDL